MAIITQHARTHTRSTFREFSAVQLKDECVCVCVWLLEIRVIAPKVRGADLDVNLDH